MDPVKWSAVGAVAAACIAIVSAVIAIWQARSGWRSANAAEQQVTEAKRANDLAERHRSEDKEQARPHLEVHAAPIIRLAQYIGEDGKRHIRSEGLGEVKVTVENTSTRDVTVNHLGIEAIQASDEYILSNSDNAPESVVLPQGHQLTCDIEGELVLGLLWMDEDEQLSECEIAIFASSAPWTSGDEQRRWYSKTFVARSSG